MTCRAIQKNGSVCSKPIKANGFCGVHRFENSVANETETELHVDQFYTKEPVAKQCIDKVSSRFNDFDIILEPSAGRGSFLKRLPREKRLGLDINPQNDEIVKMDFFDYKSVPDKKYLVIGNPPFGRVSSLAVKFFNKASEFASMIAFIIPRSFKRITIQNRLCLDFHLVHSEDLPTSPCCFEPAMSAKCCFQIWIKRDIKREIVVLNKTHNDFTFVKDETEADFGMRRVGSCCGTIYTDGYEQLCSKNIHWIKANIDKTELIRRFKSLDYSICQDTCRQNSIGVQDIIALYQEAFDE
jgi:predicted RNA methylase